MKQRTKKRQIQSVTEKGGLSNVRKKIKETDIAYIYFLATDPDWIQSDDKCIISHVLCHTTICYNVHCIVSHFVMSRYNIQGQGFSS